MSNLSLFAFCFALFLCAALPAASTAGESAGGEDQARAQAADSATASAQVPCEAPGADEFDFWVGKWDLTWDGGRGTNRIRKILDGCIVQENFQGRMPHGIFKGMSVSAYDPEQGQWKQTWVDNRGGYLDFTGGFEVDRMVLQRQAGRKRKTFLQRMVWYNITADSLDWSWERSDDRGKTWTTNWKIHYARSADGAAE